MGSGAFGLVWPITIFYISKFNINLSRLNCDLNGHPELYGTNIFQRKTGLFQMFIHLEISLKYLVKKVSDKISFEE